MVNIKDSGKYCYVEGDDCYILYYLFGYRLNNDKCYFKSKYLERVMNGLKKKKINYRLNNIYINNDINYVKYSELGKNKYEYDRYLLNIENKLNNLVGSKNFKKIYRKIINKIYE